MDAAESVTSQGYDDWYLPSIEELELMYSTIGQNTNTGGFANDYYWSSSETNNNNEWTLHYSDGDANNYDKDNTDRVRVIRAF